MKILRSNFNKILVGFMILLLVFLAIRYGGAFKKTCKDDGCFDRSLRSCWWTVYFKEEDGNILRYDIVGPRSGGCLVTVKMERMKIGVRYELVEMFQGKEMKCVIPGDNEKSLWEMENLLDYCTGPLKEAMYKLIMQRMYGLTVKNIGTIIEEIERAVS